MSNEDNSKLLGMDYVEDVDEFLYQEYLDLKSFVLDCAKTEILKKAETKAFEKGREEGLEKVREEYQKDFIVNAYKENIPVEKIARICQTSLAKVNKIIKKYCL